MPTVLDAETAVPQVHRAALPAGVGESEQYPRRAMVAGVGVGLRGRSDRGQSAAGAGRRRLGHLGQCGPGGQLQSRDAEVAG
jgi:hypothetical protein